MLSMDYWKLFLDTGAPEMYLMYNAAKRAEVTNVFNDQGTGTACNDL